MSLKCSASQVTFSGREAILARLLLAILAPGLGSGLFVSNLPSW
jgi:hypothetical protein